MTDYEDLAFEPKMTWEELKEYAKKYDTYKEDADNRFFNLSNDLFFCYNGKIDTFNYNLANDRTYEQMKTIIDNLFGE